MTLTKISLISPAVKTFSNIFMGYQKKSTSRKERIPLVEYAVLVGIFNFLFGVVSRQTLKKPEAFRSSDIQWKELLFLGVSVHKISRLISKDAVTAPFRAPFTRYKESLGYGELSEEARGSGFREVIGELLSCTYCLDVWIALLLFAGLNRVPRLTRLSMTFFSSVALADFFHVIYEVTRTRENVLTLKEQSMEKKAA